MIDWSMKDTPRGEDEVKRRGELMDWCDHCNNFVSMSEYTGRCPVCDSMMYRMRCTRCKYEWYPRSPGKLPGTCPSCKSPYYNRSYTKGVENASKAKKQETKEATA